MDITGKAILNLTLNRVGCQAVLVDILRVGSVAVSHLGEAGKDGSLIHSKKMC